eukprot:887179-Heterocapsa_arctica.AAC.1
MGPDYSMPKEDKEHLEFNKEMAKLQSAEKALAALDDQEESLELIRAKIKEVRKSANGGVVNNKKWLKQPIQICGKKLMDLNAQYKRTVEDID